MLLVILYPMVANTVFANLHCVNVETSVAVYTGLEQDGATLRANGIDPNDPTNVISNTQITVSVLQANPVIVCYELFHKIVAVMSIITLACYILAFPLFTGIFVHWRTQRIMEESTLAILWRRAKNTDAYRQQQYLKVVVRQPRLYWWRRVKVALCCAGKRYTGLISSRFLDTTGAPLTADAAIAQSTSFKPTLARSGGTSSSGATGPGPVVVANPLAGAASGNAAPSSSVDGAAPDDIAQQASSVIGHQATSVHSRKFAMEYINQLPVCLRRLGWYFIDRSKSVITANDIVNNNPEVRR
jgi:hypothetical protein